MLRSRRKGETDKSNNDLPCVRDTLSLLFLGESYVLEESIISDADAIRAEKPNMNSLPLYIHHQTACWNLLSCGQAMIYPRGYP
jgi:hypothetical protein